MTITTLEFIKEAAHLPPRELRDTRNTPFWEVVTNWADKEEQRHFFWDKRQAEQFYCSKAAV